MAEGQSQPASKEIVRYFSRKRPWIFRHARQVLFGFFFVCIFLNYTLEPALNFGLAHLAIIVVFGAVGLCWVAERRRRIHHTSARHRNVYYWVAGVYLVWRLLESRQNVWFFGDCAKLVLILLAVTAYWMLDRANCHFPYVCRVLPPMLAVAIVLAIYQQGVISNVLYSQRLAVPALGYAPELAFVIATALALHLYSLSQKPQLLWWYVVLFILFVGQFLAFQKDGVVAATIILASYVWCARSGNKRAVVLMFLLVPLLLLISSLRISDYSMGQRFSLQNAAWTLANRQRDWDVWIHQVIENKAVLFGVGLGALKPINSSTGYFFRDPENVYIGMMGDFGLVGLVLYCGLLVAFWKNIGKDPDRLRRALLRGMFWAYVATSFSGAAWRHSWITWYVAYLFYLFVFPRDLPASRGWATNKISTKLLRQLVPERRAARTVRPTLTLLPGT